MTPVAVSVVAFAYFWVFATVAALVPSAWCEEHVAQHIGPCLVNGLTFASGVGFGYALVAP